MVRSVAGLVVRGFTKTTLNQAPPGREVGSVTVVIAPVADAEPCEGCSVLYMPQLS